jgi:hypothetical protein
VELVVTITLMVQKVLVMVVVEVAAVKELAMLEKE